jgi:hypothetical protein
MPADEREKVRGGSAPETRNSSEEEYSHRYRHAGIEKRDGRIPLWLTLVVVGLLLWSVY